MVRIIESRGPTTTRVAYVAESFSEFAALLNALASVPWSWGSQWHSEPAQQIAQRARQLNTLTPTALGALATWR